jgi:hypothetical protein
MPDADHEDSDFRVLYSGREKIVAHSIAQEIAKLTAAQGLAKLARVSDNPNRFPGKSAILSAVCRPFFPSSFSAVRESSIVQAKVLDHLLKGDGLLLAPTKTFENPLGQVDVLDVVQVLKDGLADIVALAPPGLLCQSIQATFDALRQPDRQHIMISIVSATYMYDN